MYVCTNVRTYVCLCQCQCQCRCWCLCMYMCIFMCMCMCVCVCSFVCVFVHVYVYVIVNVNVYLYVYCISICLCICICICRKICKCRCKCMGMSLCMYIDVYAMQWKHGSMGVCTYVCMYVGYCIFIVKYTYVLFMYTIAISNLFWVFERCSWSRWDVVHCEFWSDLWDSQALNSQQLAGLGDVYAERFRKQRMPQSLIEETWRHQ